jgi:hypothetical protein
MSKFSRAGRHSGERERIANLKTIVRSEMKYTLMFYLSPSEFAARTDPQQRDVYWGSVMPYMKAVKDAGIFVGGAGLEPPETATTLNTRDGKRLVQDGPYADTKEQLGGLFFIDVPDLDTALEWAGRYPAGNGGVVEVRPNLVPTE